MRDNTKNLPDSGEVSISPQSNSHSGSILQFLSDTELVELPSKGLIYKNPALTSGKVEIKYITLIQEDIVSNKSYLKDSSMLTRLVSSLLVDKTIKPEELATADFMSIVYASRVTAYGPLYDASVVCPVCMHSNPVKVDMSNLEKSHKLRSEAYDAQYDLKTNNIVINLEHKGHKIEVIMRLSLYLDEVRNAKLQDNLSDKKFGSFSQVDQILPLVESVRTSQAMSTDRNEIRDFLAQIPSSLALDLKLAYKELQPRCANIIEIACTSCGNQVVREVGVNANFFWPDKGR